MADVPVRVNSARFGFRGEWYDEGDELEVPEAIAERHPSTLERLDDGEGGDEGDEAEEDEGESYTRDELADMDYGELQSLAAESDDVAGNAPKDEIVDALAEED